MDELVPPQIIEQVSQAQALLNHHLAPTLLAIHLYGSALEGGLKPYSDIDLLVTLSAPPDEATRQALLQELLTISAPPGQSQTWRPLEVTAVSHSEVVPWRYPPRREFQFGEWMRQDLLAGIFEPPTPDIDLAILLTQVRQHSIALAGPPAEQLFDPVPMQNLRSAFSGTLQQWNIETDWAGDERNVLLALARIWYSASTGQIAPKDVAAAWVLERLPAKYRPVLQEARQGYLGLTEDQLSARAAEVETFIMFAKSAITALLSDK